jgi:DNA-binding NtrC family response regulator
VSATIRPSKNHRPGLLIADDDRAILDVVSRFGEQAGFKVVACAGGREALAHLEHERTDVAVVDLRMPDVNGLDVLRSIRDTDPDCQVILMSGAATIDSAVEAAKLGAIDYLTKPFDFERLKAVLASVKDEVARRRRLLVAEREVAKNLEFCGMVGRSPVMQELFGLIKRLAPHVRTALLTGETGVGKELVARALYQSGPRRQKRFVALNCSAIAESLFETELFGHTRGAFTGAADNKPGVFEFADGGTVFLDEIGELPLASQAKLLRVLESGEVQRVGSVEARRVDVRVIAATNRDLRAEADAGRFRSDLYYRLNVAEIHIAPLRGRREDIPYLTASFIRDISARLDKRLIGTTPAAERRLGEARWDGNVRELRNVIERACILADSEFITERELASSVGWTAPPPVPAPATRVVASEDDQSLSQLECARIREVMQRTGGNKVAAARMLGLSRRALYRRLERHGLDGTAGAGGPVAS